MQRRTFAIGLAALASLAVQPAAAEAQTVPVGAIEILTGPTAA